MHGSLALGCFSEARSDIDLLVVSGRSLTEDDKLAVVDLFLRLSPAPYPVEAHVLTPIEVDEDERRRPIDYVAGHVRG